MLEKAKRNQFGEYGSRTKGLTYATVGFWAAALLGEGGGTSREFGCSIERLKMYTERAGKSLKRPRENHGGRWWS